MIVSDDGRKSDAAREQNTDHHSTFIIHSSRRTATSCNQQTAAHAHINQTTERRFCRSA